MNSNELSCKNERWNAIDVRGRATAFGTKRRLAVFLFATTCLSSGLAQAGDKASPEATPPSVDWTVMIFMNADNNLEPEALTNFADMAKVGSSEKVKIVVQFDRNGGYAYTEPQWTQTLRFLVGKGMIAQPSTAIEDIGEADMGDGAVLKAFVDWAKAKYPARHYLLSIWDHGQGWRIMRRPPGMTPDDKAKSAEGFRSISPPAVHSAPFRSVSMDETNGNNQLYNRKIQDALSGANLDVIGFDACLMSMVETAYALRQVASVMVGSEELEPGSGWQYDDWLGQLVRDPSKDAAAVGSLLVSSFKNRYGDHEATTLAAIDLSQIEDLAKSVGALGDTLTTELNDHSNSIVTARARCAVYAPNAFGDQKDYFQHIDLGRFCEQVAASSQADDVRRMAADVRSNLKKCVLANYASRLRQGNFGSTGLAIYFPRSGSIYQADPYQQGGYEKNNTKYPVEFVQKFHWSDFLHQYFAKVPN